VGFGLLSFGVVLVWVLFVIRVICFGGCFFWEAGRLFCCFCIWLGRARRGCGWFVLIFLLTCCTILMFMVS